MEGGKAGRWGWYRNIYALRLVEKGGLLAWRGGGFLEGLALLNWRENIDGFQCL